MEELFEMDITITWPDTRWQEVVDMLGDQPAKRSMWHILEIQRHAREQTVAAQTNGAVPMKED